MMARQQASTVGVIDPMSYATHEQYLSAFRELADTEIAARAESLCASPQCNEACASMARDILELLVGYVSRWEKTF